MVGLVETVDDVQVQDDDSKTLESSNLSLPRLSCDNSDDENEIQIDDGFNDHGG